MSWIKHPFSKISVWVPDRQPANGSQKITAKKEADNKADKKAKKPSKK